MTYHLASLRLRSIGERSARFTDLQLDLTAPGGPAGMSTVPADSIVWLRNGGGKSSLLSLFYALLLPHANDFMGRSVKRSLTDYVDSGDTSHTIAVWHPADHPTLLGEPDRVLITGAIYEWTELRRPADPDKDRDRLNASYYAFFAVPGVIDAATLPLADEQGQPLRRSAVLNRLRDIAAEHVTAMDLSLPRNQREWTEELQARGIDPELFRRQKEMNHVEGGVEDLFRFASARDFIDFLLDLTVPPEEATPVAERLERIGDLLSTRPAKTKERDFCREAALGLGRIDAARDGLTDAQIALARAEHAAARLAGSFAAAIALAQEAGASLQEQGEEVQAAFDRASQRRSSAADLEHLYRHHAGTLRIGHAQQAHAAAIEDAARATAAVEAWRLTQRLAEQVHLEAQLGQVRAEASEERAETAPLRAARDDRAAVLLRRLTVLAGRATDEAEISRDQVREQLALADDHGKAAESFRAEYNDAISDVATAKAHLGQVANAVAQAVSAGLLPQAEASPEAELERRRILLDVREQELTAVRDIRVGQRPQRRRELTDRQQEFNTERVSADNERARVARDLASLHDRAQTLATTPRIRELAEATDAAPVDLWGEAPALARRLVDEVRHADEELIRLRAIRLDEERSLDAQSRTGLLPTSLDADRVLTALTGRDIPAEAGWAHLRANWAGDRLARALTDPALARLGCGVVVPTDRAAEAARVLAALDTVTTALVEVYSATAADDLVRGDHEPVAVHEPAWRGLHPGLVDTGVAASAASAIRSRLAADDTTRERMLEQRDADRALIGTLDALRRDCPDGQLGALERRLSEFDAMLEQLDERLRGVRTDLDDLAAQESADAERERALQNEIRALSESVLQLGVLSEAAAQVSHWREILDGGTRRQTQAQDDAERAGGAERDARRAAMHAEQSARSFDDDAADLRAEAARLKFLEPRDEADEAGREAESQADGAVPLDTLRQLFRDADGAYQQRVSQSVLAERERGLAERLSGVAGEVSRARPENRQRAHELLSTTRGQSEESRSRATVEAEQARTLADNAVGEMSAQVAAARGAVATLIARRALPTMALPAVMSSPEAAEQVAEEHAQTAEQAKAEMDAAERLRAGLVAEADRVRSRITAFEFLLDGLPDPGPGPDAEPATAFDRDESAARDAKRDVTALLSTAQDRHRQAETAFTAAVSAVRSAGARYGDVQTPARDRVVNDAPDVLASTASTLAEHLTLRAEMIDDELAAIASDQAIVTKSLSHLVSDTLDTLRKAERYSRLPASLGPWAGKQMLRIGFEAPATESDLNAHIDQVIERCIATGIKPQGLPLLKEAVHEAAGPRGFRVKVLKPAPDIHLAAASSEDITRLGKWSGGEKLTVCVAIYCTLAALRARNTGRGNASGGVLMLDNPIGRASHGSLVTLQRNVAAAHGVQLIYTTGVKDPDAVSRFPNVIRLDNRPGRTRSRRYIVQSEPQPGEPDAVRTVIGTRVAHDEGLAGPQASAHADDDAGKDAPGE